MHRTVIILVASSFVLSACSRSGSEPLSSSNAPVASDSATTLTTAFTDAPATTSPPTTPARVSSPGTVDTPATDTATAPSATSAVALPETITVTEADLVRFVASVETVLEGTPNQGIVYDAPEIYIAIAQGACARFSAGDSFEQVSDDLLTDLASTSPDDDDDRLVGAILGAATRTICPEHAELIDP